MLSRACISCHQTRGGGTTIMAIKKFEVGYLRWLVKTVRAMMEVIRTSVHYETAKSVAQLSTQRCHAQSHVRSNNEKKQGESCGGSSQENILAGSLSQVHIAPSFPRSLFFCPVPGNVPFSLYTSIFPPVLLPFLSAHRPVLPFIQSSRSPSFVSLRKFAE